MNFSLVGTYDGENSEDLVCSVTNGNYVFAAEGNGGLRILNKATPTALTLASYSPLGTFTFNEGDFLSNISGLAISEDGNTLYIGGNISDSGDACLISIDVTDKTAPVSAALNFINIAEELSEGDSIGFVSENQAVLLLGNTGAAVKVFNADTGQSIIASVNLEDFTLYDNPIEADGGCTNVFERMAVVSFMSISALFILEYFPADFTIRVRLYDISDPSNPDLVSTSELVEHFALSDELDGFSCDDAGLVCFLGLLLDGDNENGVSINIVIWNVASPTPGTPVLVSSTATDIPLGEVSVLPRQSGLSNNVLVIVVSSEISVGVYAYDISTPATPVALTQDETRSTTSVCFAYPYFFTTAEDSLMYSWLIEGGNTPVASAIDPDHGPVAGGTSVTITGSGFSQGGTTVTIGGITVGPDAPDVVVAEDGLSLVFLTPAHAAGAVDVIVTVDNVDSEALSFTYGNTPSSGYLEKTDL